MRFKNITDADGSIIFHALCAEEFGTTDIVCDSRVNNLIKMEDLLPIFDKHFGEIKKILFEEVNSKIRVCIVRFDNHVVELNAIDEEAKDEEGRHYRSRNYIFYDGDTKENFKLSVLADFKVVTWVRVGTPLRIHGESKSTLNGALLDDFFTDYYGKSYTETEELNNTIYFITEAGGHLRLDEETLVVDTYGEDIIDENYNECFKTAYDKMVKFMSSEESGLVLLSGLPGTGKSSLIVHLASVSHKLKKRIVLIPSNFGDVLMSPSFMNFAIQHLKDAILVIEDAEHVLRSRTEGGNMAVTNILNLSDGILSSILKIKIVTTINIEEGLDNALMRKGRLKMSYYFDKLKTDRGNKLLKKLGSKETISEPHTLADIYNMSEKVDFDGKNVRKKPMGFG